MTTAGIGFDVGNEWLSALLGLIVIVLLMTVVVLLLIYLERKIAGRIQMRLGPMRVGPYGLLQTLADTVKLLTKEDLRPAGANRILFELAVFAIFVPAFLAFVAIPFTRNLALSFLDLGLLYIVAVTGLSFIGFLMAGWASDNKYALLGGLRAAAQLISYEIPLVLSLVALSMVAGSLNLTKIVEFQDKVPLIAWQPLTFFIFMAAALSELERQPFDIPTAESEVVGGPFIEYSGMRWSMFMLTSFANLFIYSLLAASIFLGGWNWPLGNEAGWLLQVLWIALKTSLFIFMFIWIRFAMPRLRVDQLMSYCWKALIPFAFLQIFLNGLALTYGWPDGVIGLLSAVALVLFGYVMYRAVRVEPRRVTLVPAHSGAPPLPGAATSEAGG
jgi:NADH-quinone oxidoreductase subunit H